MAKFTDGKQYVGLYIGYWKDDHYTPDFSNDFFDVGLLKMDDDGFYIVEDIDYCIEMMEDWCEGRGDYFCDGSEDPHFDCRVIAINRNKEELM